MIVTEKASMVRLSLNMLHQQKRDSPCGYLSFVYVSSSALASDGPVVAAGYIIKQSRVDELAHQQGVRRLLPSASQSDVGHEVSSWLKGV